VVSLFPLLRYPQTIYEFLSLRIFLIDGVCTIASGVAALLLLPKSPRHTAGGIRGKGWFTEREADVFLARIQTSDPLKEHEGTLRIKWSDVLEVLTTWRLYPHLLMCLSGLQSTRELSRLYFS
jgi:hypothetical protein